MSRLQSTDTAVANWGTSYFFLQIIAFFMEALMCSLLRIWKIQKCMKGNIRHPQVLPHEGACRVSWPPQAPPCSSAGHAHTAAGGGQHESDHVSDCLNCSVASKALVIWHMLLCFPLPDPLLSVTASYVLYRLYPGLYLCYICLLGFVCPTLMRMWALKHEDHVTVMSLELVSDWNITGA